jgi:hypothetical protein
VVVKAIEYQVVGVGRVLHLVGKPVGHLLAEHTVQARVIIKLLRHPALAAVAADTAGVDALHLLLLRQLPKQTELKQDKKQEMPFRIDYVTKYLMNVAHSWARVSLYIAEVTVFVSTSRSR